MQSQANLQKESRSWFYHQPSHSGTVYLTVVETVVKMIAAIISFQTCKILSHSI